MFNRVISQLAILCIAAALAACSMDDVSYKPPSVAVGGTITGLDGVGLVLTNNGGDDLAVSGNGAFTFATPLVRGTSYALAVKSHPSNPTQLCSLTNDSGIAGNEDVLDVQVSCQTRTFHVGGTVTGLAGSGLMLQNNGGDNLAIGPDDSFTFVTPIASGSTFGVTVLAQPAGPSQTCTVSGGTGTVGGGAVTSVAVNCTTNRYSVSGTVTGLAANNTITLRNNGGDNLLRMANGSFTFPTPVTSGQPYDVTIVANPTSPISQTCTVTNGGGSVDSGDVTNVQVICTTNMFTISGSISNLTPGFNGIVLNNNGVGLSLSAPVSFTFPLPVASGATYNVIVTTPPENKNCHVENGTGTVGNSNVFNVHVVCS